MAAGIGRAAGLAADPVVAGLAADPVVAGRARAGQVAAGVDPAGAGRVAAADRVAEDEALGKMRPVGEGRAEGHPTGKTARASDFEVETVPNATSTTGRRIEEGEAHPVAVRGRGSAMTSRDRARIGRGNRAADGRRIEATTGRGGSRARRSATARGGSRAAHRAVASIADSNGVRIAGSSVRDPRGRGVPPAARREPRSVRGHATGEHRAPTVGPRLGHILGPTGRARGRTDPESQRVASRAPTWPACSVRTRSLWPAGDRWKRHSSPDATLTG
jgi:hypothetical protein